MRVKWIDECKGFLGVLVIIGHTLVWSGVTDYSTYAYTYIYSFHMPAFFVISGLFADRSMHKLSTDFFLKLLKRCVNLIVPTVLFSILYAASLYFLCSYTLFDALKQTVVNYWFMYVMVLIYVGYSILKLVVKSSLVLAMTFFLMTCCFGLLNNSIAMLCGYFFLYLSGTVLAEAKVFTYMHEKFIGFTKWFLIFCGFVLSTGIVTFFHTLYQKSIVLNAYYKTFAGLLISFWVIMTFCLLQGPVTKMFEKFSAFTLQMYLAQFAFTRWTEYYIESPSILEALVWFVILTAIGLLTALICEKAHTTKVYQFIFSPYQFLEEKLKNHK